MLQRTAIIKDTRTMYDFLLKNFSCPAASSFNARTKSVQLNRRIFFQIPATGEGGGQRNRPGCQFKTLKDIRKLHCLKSVPQQEKLLVRFRSSYCVNCLMDDEPKCLYKDWLNDWKEESVV